MKSIRRTLVFVLAVLMMIGAVMPAYADELDNEDELIEAALAAQENAPEETDPQDGASLEGETESETPADAPAESETEETVALDGGVESAFVWQEPGNRDLNILSGGTMLTDGSAYYYVDDDIRCIVDGEERTISNESGRNLNRAEDWLYYTTDSAVRRFSLSDGTAETVYDCADIDQLYVIGRWLVYTQNGGAYTYDMTAGTLSRLDAPEAVTGLIPTQYGNIYLTGGAFDRCVWVGGSVALEAVESCYTDSGYLVVNRDGTHQIALESLFSGSTALSDYTLHQDEIAVPQMTEAEAMAAETAYFESEEYAAIEALGEQDDGVALMALDGASGSIYITAQQLALSSGDTDSYNITLRARQHAEVLWTPLKDVLAWGGGTYRADRTVTSKQGVTTNYFKAGQTYQGIPYSQAVYTSSHKEETYVGCQLSITKFVEYVGNSGSKMYTGKSTYGQIAPYYGSDCAGFVSAAWALPVRCSCPTLVSYSTPIGTNLNQIQLGDCLNKSTSHVVLVTDIAYDYYGNIVSIEITEQTPLRMKVTNYGARIPGKTNEEIYYVSNLQYVQTYYLNNGYYIYRRNYSGSVGYTAEAAVPLEEDGWLSAPMLRMAANDDGTAVIVSLEHMDDEPIRYTTDGSAATLSSPLYTGPITVTEKTTIRAIADYSGGAATGAFELIYTVEAEKADKPVIECQSGALDGTVVAADSVVTFSSCEGATIYYTTDGTEPTMASAKLDENGIRITQDTTIRAFAVAADRIRSEEVKIALTVGTFYEVTTSVTGSGTISPSGSVRVHEGESQTFTIKAGTNYKIGDVLVDGKSVGAKTSYTLSNITADHTIEAKFVISLPFTDVKTTSWYADYVAYAYTNDLLKGVTTTSFGPRLNMTRGQFATLLGRYAGQSGKLENFKTGTVAYTNGFSIILRQSASTSSTAVSYIADMNTFVKVTGSVKDASGALWYKVEYNGKSGYIKATYNGKDLLKMYDGKFADISGCYYNGYIQWAYQNELINGTSSTWFGSEESITRQDLCVVLYRYLTKYCNKTLSTGSTTFTDESRIKDYAKTAVHALAEIGVVNGYTDGSFQPREYATRAEVATMFMRLDEYLNG